MKRAILGVLCLCSSAAWGQADLDYSFTYVGSYTPTGLTTLIDVYDLTFSDSGPSHGPYPPEIGAVVLDLGADYLGYGNNPFQVGIQGPLGYVATPEDEDADTWLATETFARQSDSHFLFPAGAAFIVSPTESNDGSLGTYTDPYGQTEVRGLGGLAVAAAIDRSDRTAVTDVARVGIPRDSVVYFKGQICGPLGLVRSVEAVQFPMGCQNAWQGAGTSGQTSTDPNDPTVQWNQVGNWSRGVVPTPSDGVRVEMTNPGLLVAASGSVGSLSVDVVCPGASFQIPGAADVSVTGSLIVGERGTATATQSGTARSLFFSLGENGGAAGSYELTDGQLTVDRAAYVGKQGEGVFSQTGGTVQVGGMLSVGRFEGARGTYRLQGGYVGAESVDVGNGRSLLDQTGGSLSSDQVSVMYASTYLLGGGEVRTLAETAYGTFIQTGGTNTITDQLTVGGYQGGGMYEMRGGVLSAGAISVEPGEWGKLSALQLVSGEVNALTAALTGDIIQQGGLLSVDQVHLSYPSHYQLQGGELRAGLLDAEGTFAQTGGSLGTDELALGSRKNFRLDDGLIGAGIEGVRGSFIQTGGTNIVAGALTISTDPRDRAVYQLWGGMLSAGTINGPVSMLGGLFGVQSMDGVLTNDGGVINPGHSVGTMALGGLVQTAGTLLIELGGLGDCDQVVVANSAELGGVVDAQSLTGYRPREGDRFTIISSDDPNGLLSAGNFNVFTSNITTGLPDSTAFSGAVEGAQYKITFLGYTTGDANGDHSVDGGDLALMGGNWMRGGSRPMPGDANLDDVVNGGDLALIGGNWMLSGMSWADGDFNGDGNVDGGDLALMGGNWLNRVMGWADCDFNNDGKVDGGDLALMSGDWNWALSQADPPVGKALPEPAAALLMAVGGGVLWRRRRGG